MQRAGNWLFDEEKRQLFCAVVGGFGLALSFFDVKFGPLDPAWIAVFLCGYPIVKEALVGLVTRFDIKADVLVAMALIASVIIGEIFAAGEVAFIMSLGSLLEERTVRKAREGIERLVKLTPRTARVLRDGKETSLAAEEVRPGDTVRVLPGESVPVDGLVLLGRTAIDQSLLTGESLPVDKDAGDEVYSGTVNQLGAFDMRATKAGEDSSMQRMIRLVESADADKTPVVRIMDRWATWIVVAAFVTAMGTWALTGEIIRAVTILVVFCPCALVLSTPTAIMAGIGNATRFGVLIASGDALERLAQVTRVAFDKTGTLTYGKPEVTAVYPISGQAPGQNSDQSPEQAVDDLLVLAASIEQRSEHPLGKALVRHARQKGLALQEAEAFTAIPGRGVTAVIDGHEYFGGTRQLMVDKGLAFSPELEAFTARSTDNGATVIYIASSKGLVGCIVFADTLRPDAAQTLRALSEQGVKSTLLTGDNALAAKNIAQASGIEDVRAHLLPEDKVKAVRDDLPGQGDKVCMVGDGINDAPALKAAHVGLAMGGVGSDIAVDAADAVLVHDDIKRLPQLILLARQTVSTIKTNITLSMLLNLITVVLAAFGLMGPVVGALAHNAGALLIVLNSTRLLRWKP